MALMFKKHLGNADEIPHITSYIYEDFESRSVEAISSHAIEPTLEEIVQEKFLAAYDQGSLTVVEVRSRLPGALGA